MRGLKREMERDLSAMRQRSQKTFRVMVDTPLYSALHNVSLYSMADKQLLFSYADKVVEAPYHSKSHELSQAESMADWNALEMYLPKIDEEWLGDASLSLVDTLRRKDWDVNRITIKYLWK